MSEPEYKVGQVWTHKDGKQRKIVAIWDGMSHRSREVFDSTKHAGSSWHIDWQRPSGGAVRACWCSTWSEWANKATLAE